MPKSRLRLSQQNNPHYFCKGLFRCRNIKEVVVKRPLFLLRIYRFCLDKCASEGLNLVPAFDGGWLVVGRDVGFKEITFYIAFSVCVGNLFELFVRIFVIAVIERVQSQVFEAFIGNKFGVLFNGGGGNADYLVADDMVAPGDFLFNGFGVMA